MKSLEAFEHIKMCPTIYVGCGSDVNTRCAYECDIVEKDLKELAERYLMRYPKANKYKGELELL